MATDCEDSLDVSVGEPCKFNSPVTVSEGPRHLVPNRRAIGSLIKKWWPWFQERDTMVQGKNILISGGKLNNVGGDYHEHNTTYVIKEAPKDLEPLRGQYYFINFIYIHDRV
jgi:hypothetical protein